MSTLREKLPSRRGAAGASNVQSAGRTGVPAASREVRVQERPARAESKHRAVQVYAGPPPWRRILLPTCIDEPPLVDADARSGQLRAMARVETLNGRVD